MDTKSLSFCQVRWAQELLRYHFQIDYRQGKANGAADALFQFPQKSSNKEEKLQAENTQILHYLQTLVTSTSLSRLTLSPDLSPLYQVFICGTYVQPQLCQFWTNLQTELVDKHPYWASIGGIRLRLPELQESDNKAWKIRADGLNGYEEVNGVLHHQCLPFIPEIIWTELISQHHNDPLAGYFGVNKTRELIGRKYYWPSLRKDVKAYIKVWDVCLGSKAVRHKPYGDLQSLPVPTHRWKDLLMDFVTELPVSTNCKGETYNSILVIIDCLSKMVHYKPVKVTFDAPGMLKSFLM